MGCGASSALPTAGPMPVRSPGKFARNITTFATRESFLSAAAALKDENAAKFPHGRHLLVVYSSTGQHNHAKHIMEDAALPMFEAAGIRTTVVASKFKSFPTSYFRSFDYASVNGIVVCGGDAFLNEIVSAILSYRDDVPCPIGIVPAGSVNVLASHLDEDQTPASRLPLAAALAIVRGELRPNDVLCINSGSGVCRFALTSLAWGLPATAIASLESHHWLPRRRPQMEPVALLNSVKTWSPARAVLSYPPNAVEDAPVEWTERNVGLVGLLATNVPSMGAGNPICKAADDADGYVIVTMVYESATRADVLRAALAMKKGKYLTDNSIFKTVRVREFKLAPHDGTDVPFLVDGDLMGAGSVHVKVLKQKLTLFAHPHELSLDTATVKSSTVSMFEKSPSETSDGMNETVTQDEIRKVMRRGSFMARKREARRGNAADELISNLEGAIEFVTDEFDTEDLEEGIKELEANGELDDEIFEDSGPDSPIPDSALQSGIIEEESDPPTLAVPAAPAAVPTTARQESTEVLVPARRGSKEGDEMKPRRGSKEGDESKPRRGSKECDEMKPRRGSHQALATLVIERSRAIRSLSGRPVQGPKHITVIFNPVSGAGKAKKVVDQIVVPVLQAANIKVVVVPTQYRGFATEHVTKLNIKETDGVVVCGGDGMVSEVITGLLQRTDEAARNFPVGIVAVGTANAMANYIDNGRAKNQVELVTNASLATARGHTMRVDVIEIKSKSYTKYALSCVGWGLAGAVGQQADKLRWVPGQKQARYDIAGAVTMLSDWPIVCRGQLSYPVTEAGPDGAKSTVWKSKNIGCINLIASNVPLLGNDHPICKDISAQDGKMAIALIDQSMSRTAVIKAALSMKRGNYLVESKYVESVITSEFKLMPLEGARGSDIPYNIDGDPVEPSSMHVKILNQRLRVYCLPRSGPLTV
eukprot:m.139873 g.139873  ORF g.139873 m.139873 type:complete len:933 (-) comp9621_c0_seq2:187-2985(-)